MATAKHKLQRLVFNPKNQLLIGFWDEFHKLAKDAFKFAAPANIEQFIYANLSPHPKKSMNQAHLENDNYERFLLHLGKKVQMNDLKAPDEQQLNAVTHNATKPNPDEPGPTCHHCKKPDHYRAHCSQFKR